MMTRREALLNGLRLVACGALSKAAPSLLAQSSLASLPPLKTTSACFGGLVGIAAPKASLQDASFVKIVVRDFNLLTASGMKWSGIHPGPDTYDFSEADWNMHFAEDNGLQVHGHNLCWNAPDNPAWFKTVLNKSNAKQYLTEHITTVMKRYRGRIQSWDVVNEPVVPWPGRSDGLYPGIWLDLLGPEYIDIAFHAAALADPKPLRVLNIHHVEQGTADDELNRKRALALLKQLLDRGVPVQAVGLESHLDDSQPLAGEALRRFISDIRALNLQVLITELDVKENRAVGDSRNWDDTVAKYYGDYLAEVVAAANPPCVIFWSLKDRWESGRRIQGLMQDNLSPRLSYPAALKALQKNGSCDG
jgi:endo-1,4-beta-xylanase